VAALTHRLNLGDDDQLPAWGTVIALSEVMETSELTIVGGLMVYLHATRGGVTMPRSTDDADFLLNAMVHPASLTAFAVAVGKLGFQLKDDEQYAYRFVHEDGRRIDAMVPDHLPSRVDIRLRRKPALTVPAGVPDEIADETAAPWVNLDAAARAQARMNLELVTTAMDVR
jgi:hypothetical protein